MVTRRTLLASALAAVPLSAKTWGFHLGVTDWNLKQAGKIEAVGLASRLGFEGVQVSLGRKPVDDKLPLDNSALQEQYLAEAKKYNIAVAGTCLDILHVNYLKNDKLGQKWWPTASRSQKAERESDAAFPSSAKARWRPRKRWITSATCCANSEPKQRKRV